MTSYSSESKSNHPTQSLLTNNIISLSAGLSVEHRDRLSITHIISVCPDYPSTGPNHLTIPVQDSELDNLLIHLPEACNFIQNALDQEGGRILLHCVMGISRSITVLAAYREFRFTDRLIVLSIFL